MKKGLKKFLGITGSFLAIGAIAIGAGIGVISCSSTNETTASTPASATNSNNNNDNKQTTSSNSSSSSSSSSKTEKETNNSSSSSTNTPKPANPYPNGLVSISSSITPSQNGKQLGANEYACGSSITLTANYTYPTDQDVNHNGTLYFEWFANGKLINSGTKPTYDVGQVLVNTTYSVQASYMVPLSNQNGSAKVTYSCSSSKINVTINYSNLALSLAYNDGNTKTITTSNQVTLDASLQYTLSNKNTYFTDAQLASLSDVTINFARYSFSTWNNLNNSSNDNGAIANNYKLVTTPDGIYPFRASFTINGKTIYSNILKVNTSYNGSILDFSNLPVNIQETYNYPALMQKYIVQSMSSNDSLFMELVNAECKGYRIIPLTLTGTIPASQFNGLSVNASYFDNINVKWFNAKNPDDGLLVSATLTASLELFSYQSVNSYTGDYDVSVGGSNNSISKGNTISWLLPYGNNTLNWWSQNPSNVKNQSINWNLNSDIYTPKGVLSNLNYGEKGNSSNWQFYTPYWNYPTVSFKTVAPGVYWGFTITNSSGANALQGILKANYSEVDAGQDAYGNPTTVSIYGSKGASYIAYQNFPMIQSSAAAQTGYLSLLSSCKQMLQDLYNQSIEGISVLN